MARSDLLTADERRGLFLRSLGSRLELPQRGFTPFADFEQGASAVYGPRASL